MLKWNLRVAKALQEHGPDHDDDCATGGLWQVADFSKKHVIHHEFTIHAMAFIQIALQRIRA